MKSTFFAILTAALIIDFLIRYFMGRRFASPEQGVSQGEALRIIVNTTFLEFLASFLTIIFFVIFSLLGNSGRSFSFGNPFFIIPAFFTVFACIFFGLRAYSKLKTSKWAIWMLFWILSSPAIAFLACAVWIIRSIEPGL